MAKRADWKRRSAQAMQAVSLVALGIVIGAALTGRASPPAGTDWSYRPKGQFWKWAIFADRKFVGVGDRVLPDDPIKVPIRALANHFGYEAKVDSIRGRVELTKAGTDYLPPLPGIPLAATRPETRLMGAYDGDYHWRVPLPNSDAYITFTDAKMVGATLKAKVLIGGRLFKPTSAPITVVLKVSLYDEKGETLAEENVDIDRVASDGGHYLLTGPSILHPERVYSVDVEYVNAWVSKN